MEGNYIESLVKVDDVHVYDYVNPDYEKGLFNRWKTVIDNEINLIQENVRNVQEIVRINQENTRKVHAKITIFQKILIALIIILLVICCISIIALSFSLTQKNITSNLNN